MRQRDIIPTHHSRRPEFSLRPLSTLRTASAPTAHVWLGIQSCDHVAGVGYNGWLLRRGALAEHAVYHTRLTKSLRWDRLYCVLDNSLNVFATYHEESGSSKAEALLDLEGATISYAGTEPLDDKSTVHTCRLHVPGLKSGAARLADQPPAELLLGALEERIVHSWVSAVRASINKPKFRRIRDATLEESAKRRAETRARLKLSSEKWRGLGDTGVLTMREVLPVSPLLSDSTPTASPRRSRAKVTTQYSPLVEAELPSVRARKFGIDALLQDCNIRFTRELGHGGMGGERGSVAAAAAASAAAEAWAFRHSSIRKPSPFGAEAPLMPPAAADAALAATGRVPVVLWSLRVTTDQHFASTVVQTAWRRHAARRRHWPSIHRKLRERKRRIRAKRRQNRISDHIKRLLIFAPGYSAKAGRVIQSSFRAYLVRRHFKWLASMARLIQRAYRRHHFRRGALCIAVQRRRRGLLGRRRTARLRHIYYVHAATLIWKARKAACQRFAAARCVQSRWRGRRGRLLLMEIQSAATKVQTAFRSAAAAKAFRSTLHCIVLIQARTRCTRRVMELRKQRLAALRLSAIIRGFLSKTQFGQQRAASKRLVARWRCVYQRRVYEHKRWAIVRLQAWTRRVLATNLFVTSRKFATTIAAVARRALLRATFLRQKRAACRLAGFGRGAAGALRRSYLQQRSAALRLQTAIRAWLGTRHFAWLIARLKCVTWLQRAWRGRAWYLWMKEFSAYRFWAASLLQRAVRGALVREWVRRMHDAAIASFLGFDAVSREGEADKVLIRLGRRLRVDGLTTSVPCLIGARLRVATLEVEVLNGSTGRRAVLRASDRVLRALIHRKPASVHLISGLVNLPGSLPLTARGAESAVSCSRRQRDGIALDFVRIVGVARCPSATCFGPDLGGVTPLLTKSRAAWSGSDSIEDVVEFGIQSEARDALLQVHESEILSEGSRRARLSMWTEVVRGVARRRRASEEALAHRVSAGAFGPKEAERFCELEGGAALSLWVELRRVEQKLRLGSAKCGAYGGVVECPPSNDEHVAVEELNDKPGVDDGPTSREAGCTADSMALPSSMDEAEFSDSEKEQLLDQRAAAIDARRPADTLDVLGRADNGAALRAEVGGVASDKEAVLSGPRKFHAKLRAELRQCMQRVASNRWLSLTEAVAAEEAEEDPCAAPSAIAIIARKTRTLLDALGLSLTEELGSDDVGDDRKMDAASEQMLPPHLLSMCAMLSHRVFISSGLWTAGSESDGGGGGENSEVKEGWYRAAELVPSPSPHTGCWAWIPPFLSPSQVIDAVATQHSSFLDAVEEEQSVLLVKLEKLTGSLKKLKRHAEERGIGTIKGEQSVEKKLERFDQKLDTLLSMKKSTNSELKVLRGAERAQKFDLIDTLKIERAERVLELIELQASATREVKKGLGLLQTQALGGVGELEADYMNASRLLRRAVPRNAYAANLVAVHREEQSATRSAMAHVVDLGRLLVRRKEYLLKLRLGAEACGYSRYRCGRGTGHPLGASRGVATLDPAEVDGGGAVVDGVLFHDAPFGPEAGSLAGGYVEASIELTALDRALERVCCTIGGMHRCWSDTAERHAWLLDRDVRFAEELEKDTSEAWEAHEANWATYSAESKELTANSLAKQKDLKAQAAIKLAEVREVEQRIHDAEKSISNFWWFKYVSRPLHYHHGEDEYRSDEAEEAVEDEEKEDHSAIQSQPSRKSAVARLRHAALEKARGTVEYNVTLKRNVIAAERNYLRIRHHPVTELGVSIASPLARGTKKMACRAAVQAYFITHPKARKARQEHRAATKIQLMVRTIRANERYNILRLATIQRRAVHFAAYRIQAMYRFSRNARVLYDILDATYDKVYDVEVCTHFYYHLRTGESSWDPPALLKVTKRDLPTSAKKMYKKSKVLENLRPSLALL